MIAIFKELEGADEALDRLLSLKLKIDGVEKCFSDSVLVDVIDFSLNVDRL